jgi:hypothetical protein
MQVQLGTVGKIHQPEAAGIIENHPSAIIKIEDHMVVGAGGLPILLSDQKSARHAKMHQHRRPIIEMQGEIFRPPGQPVDAATGQALGEQRGKGATQIDNTRPAMAICRPRRTVSTSGSSGMRRECALRPFLATG